MIQPVFGCTLSRLYSSLTRLLVKLFKIFPIRRNPLRLSRS